MKHCLTLDLKNNPELINEYKEWHKPGKIWKEIPEGIKDAGIEEMEIFIWENRLFMIIEINDDQDFDKCMKSIASYPRQAEWENLMDNYQQKPKGANADSKWQLMKNIFRLSECI